ncbi:MAG: hypothetical protein Q7K40_04505 [bacterium]|nr:hypothetical protein [bacterium]
MKIFRTTLFIISFGIIAHSVFAVDQVKTTETLIASEDATFIGSQSYLFTLYIGDDLSGVVNPLKSIHFTVSGVYTGVGTVEAMIDNDSGTSKIVTLPNVGGTPTPFEINYKDHSGKINPSTPGSYTYTFDINSGVTMYGMSIKMEETHRYVPPTCADGWPTNLKVKTTESMIGDSDAPLSVNTEFPFTLFIGDNLSGITPAIKSLRFTASGVYESVTSGTITFMIDNIPATEKTFTLPSTGGVPTPFEIDYKDPVDTINPTSAGSYPHVLNFNPTDITIYGLGIKLEETHKYKPAVCTGLPPTGELSSAVLDTFVTVGADQGPAYNSIMWKGTEGTGKVQFQVATSDSDTGPWTFYGSSDGGATCNTSSWYDTGTSGLGGGPGKPVEIACSARQSQNNKRYFRYRIQICSADCTASGGASPKVSDVVVNWAP